MTDELGDAHARRVTPVMPAIPRAAIAKRVALTKQAYPGSDEEHAVMAFHHIALLMTEIHWLGGQVVWPPEAPQPQGDTPS
jgi:hypothetical protein